jgi:hypothetical protein
MNLYCGPSAIVDWILSENENTTLPCIYGPGRLEADESENKPRIRSPFIEARSTYD